MRFEWDVAKQESNLSKHGFDFADAPIVFAGDLVTVQDTRAAYGEARFISLGALRGRVVVIVWTKRDAQVIRIISMRRANTNERKAYEAR